MRLTCAASVLEICYIVVMNIKRHDAFFMRDAIHFFNENGVPDSATIAMRKNIDTFDMAYIAIWDANSDEISEITEIIEQMTGFTDYTLTTFDGLKEKSKLFRQ